MTYGVTSKRSLRIALISGLSLSRDGSAQVAVPELSRELRNLGHRVRVFAPDELRPLPLHGQHDRLASLRHAGGAWAQVHEGELDVVQVDFPEAIPFAKLMRTPTVATVHHDRETDLLAHYAAHPEVAFVAVSRRQAELAWEVPFRAVIHPGLDVERYQLGKGGRRFVCLGISPENGPHLAIEAARLTRASLMLGGDVTEQDYFARAVAPHSGRGFSWVGSVDHMRRVELLANARALLAPLQWEEPFGVQMIESMLVGTPVIAYACGAASEIVEDGITGFLVHSVDEMCRRMREVAALDRRGCRARARSRWSSARMARKFAVLYQEMLDHRRSPRTPSSPDATQLKRSDLKRSGVLTVAPTSSRPSDLLDNLDVDTDRVSRPAFGSPDELLSARPPSVGRPRAR